MDHTLNHQVSWKKATINPKNNDNECSKFAVFASLHNHKINNSPERLSNLKPWKIRTSSGIKSFWKVWKT